MTLGSEYQHLILSDPLGVYRAPPTHVRCRCRGESAKRWQRAFPEYHRCLKEYDTVNEIGFQERSREQGPSLHEQGSDAARAKHPQGVEQRGRRERFDVTLS